MCVTFYRNLFVIVALCVKLFCTGPVKLHPREGSGIVADWYLFSVNVAPGKICVCVCVYRHGLLPNTPVTAVRLGGQEQPGVRGTVEVSVFVWFLLWMRKNFFSLRVTEPWPRLPREAVESPSLEIFKTHLENVLCSLLWVTLLRQRVGLGDPQRSLPTPNIL